MFRLTIETVNAAFDDAPASEIARILRDLADKLERDGVPMDGRENWRLRDVNGNTVGTAWSSKA